MRLRRALRAVKARLDKTGQQNAGMTDFKQPAAGADPYDPTVPRGKPNVAKPARAAAVAVEDQIRGDRAFETGVFLDTGGARVG